MYYRQPKYYGEFSCIGPECTANCCYGWRIDWKKDEIDKVKNAPNCSAELKEKIENSFVPRPEKGEDAFVVKLDEHGMCPCITEEGLCSIQKELGAEYMSRTCMTYPRYNSFVNGLNSAVYRGCNLSCKEVVRKLVTDEKATELINVAKNTSDHAGLICRFTKEDVAAHPELAYHGEIFDFFYELIGDKKCSVETSIVLGALAAHNLTALIANKEHDRIPEALKTFRKDAHNAAGLRAVDSIKPNYDVCFGVADEIIEGSLGFNIIQLLKDEDGKLAVSRYLAGEEKLNEMMKDKPFWLRNIALDLLLELGMPFKSIDHTVFENYSYFVTAVSCIKLNAIAAAFAPEKVGVHFGGHDSRFEGIDKIYGTTGMISRSVFQNKDSFEKVINALGKIGINSPIHLALLVK